LGDRKSQGRETRAAMTNIIDQRAKLKSLVDSQADFPFFVMSMAAAIVAITRLTWNATVPSSNPPVLQIKTCPAAG
jgi:hypothetical protein